MLWRRKQSAEVLPWYRDPNYGGTLTEPEKRKLDALRSEPRHPSTRYEDLPDEVQRYINGLELQLYDFKQEKAVSKPMLCSVASIALVYLHYRPLPLSTFLTWTVGLLLLLIPWLFYRYEWRRNAKEFMPDNPASATDEAIRREWEVEYIARHRERGESSV